MPQIQIATNVAKKVNMEQVIIKPTSRVGNSAGVLLPKKWLNSIVKVCLIHQKPNLSDILPLINANEAQGIYLTGSYARGDIEPQSDIDILIITNNSNHTKKIGKYEITYTTQNAINGENLLILYPMLLEAKTLLNSALLEELKKTAKKNLTLKLIAEYSRNCLKMLNLNEKEIQLARLKNKKYVEDQIGYSLILRLRTNFLLNCITSREKYNKKKLIKLTKKISGSEKAYNSYCNIKNNTKKKSNLPIDEAQKLLNYLKTETTKWTNEQKEFKSK